MGRVKSLIMLSKRDLRTSKKVVDQQLKQLEEMQEYCEATRCRRNLGNNVPTSVFVTKKVVNCVTIV